LTDRISDASDRARLFERVVSRWENEGGAVVEAGATERASAEGSPASLGSAEFVQMQFRVIALENLVTVLLAQSSNQQLDVVREMAAHIAANPGFTPHPPTVRAAAKMHRLLEAAGHLRTLCTAQDAVAGRRADGQPSA
jgi:hypothetical protein